MNIKPLSDYQVKDYLSFHEPGPLHTYDRMYVPGEHKYEHLWKYRYGHRPGSQIVREDEVTRPRRSVRRQADTPPGQRKPVKRLQDTPPRARRSDPPPRTREARNSPRAGAPTSTTATRRPRGKPMEMWQYKDYLSFHEPGPYHDYRSNHAPGHHPYNHMWTYNIGNRQGAQHVRVEEKTRVQRPRPVVVKPRTATPKAKPRQQAARKAEPKSTTRAVERKVATPPPPAPRQQPNRRMAAAATAAVVTQPRRQQAPPPAGRAPPPPRNTTPPPAHTTLPPRRATPPRTPIQQYRSGPHPLLTETAAPAAVPLPERVPGAYTSRIPVRQRHQEPPLRLDSPEDTGPLLRRDYKLRPESKWNAPRLDGPALTQKQRPFLRNYRDLERPRPPWRPIKTYNGTPRQGPLSTNYGDHVIRHNDYSSGLNYARSSYNYVPSPVPNYSYQPSYYYTGSQDPLSSIRRTMVLFGS